MYIDNKCSLIISTAMLILYSVFVLIISSFAKCDFPKVTINQGTLQGKYLQTWRNKSFSAFLGIPYAKPPIGDLRFEHPASAEPWKDVLLATEYKSSCSQIDIYINDLIAHGSEDCLYLNVYTPKLNNYQEEPVSVMVYIHGGGFMCGSGHSDSFDPYLLLEKNIVLVTLNYRLGPLGFLSTGDSVVPGNNGLKDQNLALKWVNENIEKFGGDAKRITIFGQSAGGASVHYHLLSPLSKGLFHRAIAQSGVGITSWSLDTNARTVRNSKELASYFNCPTSSSTEMINCLKKVNSDDITEAQKRFMLWSYNPMVPFKVVIEPPNDHILLSNHPLKIMKAGKYNKVPLMIGFNSEEGALKASALYNNSKLIEELDANFNQLAPIIFQYDDKMSNYDQISKKIRKYYFGDQHIGENTKSELVNLFTDAWTTGSLGTIVELNLKYSREPTYLYLFGYRSSVTHSRSSGDPHYYGVSHNDELLYLFGYKSFKDFNLNHHERMIDIMTTLWTNFAKTGNPTPSTDLLLKHKWESTKYDTLDYYFIENQDNVKMSNNIYLERIKFWQNLAMDFRVNRKSQNDEL